MEMLQRKKSKTIRQKVDLEKQQVEARKLRAQQALSQWHQRRLQQMNKELDLEVQVKEARLSKSSTELHHQSGQSLVKDLSHRSRPESLASIKLPPISRRQTDKSQLLEGQVKAGRLMQECMSAHIDSVKNRKVMAKMVLAGSQRRRKESEDAKVLRNLLSTFDPSHKPAMLDHSLKKYYQQQNKFVSYKMFRENYLQASNGLVHVLESDEK